MRLIYLPVIEKQREGVSILRVDEEVGEIFIKLRLGSIIRLKSVALFMFFVFYDLVSTSNIEGAAVDYNVVLSGTSRSIAELKKE